MTDDPDLLHLLTRCEFARTKVVMVGDDHQLSPVGPGGALGAMLKRYGGKAYVLDENLRQHDQSERRALAELRAGDVGYAVSWYAGHGRIKVRPDRETALVDMVDAWAEDGLAGRDAAMYAWQRGNVETLNTIARQRWREAGQLQGPELVAPGGRRFATGDLIVTLAPGPDTVNSQRGQVVDVRPHEGLLFARMDDGRIVRLGPEESGRDRLALGYAVTVHRAQGATVDVAHRLEDGGGRELAYVSMSRARERSSTWVVADDLAQAKDDLRREWSTEARARWVIDTTSVAHVGSQSPAEAVVRSLDRARLDAQRRAVSAAVPPDRGGDRWIVEGELQDLKDAERDLKTGHGVWLDTDVGQAARDLNDLVRRRSEAEAFVSMPGMGRRDRKVWRRRAKELAEKEPVARERLDRLVEPARAGLSATREQLEQERRELERACGERDGWLAEHPEAPQRLSRLEAEVRALDPPAMPTPTRERGVARTRRGLHRAEPDIGPTLEL